MAISTSPRARLSGQDPLFFKVFLPELSSENLKIPPEFFKHISKSPDIVSLIGPSGSTWYVDLVKNSDGLFFENGWKDFVADHSLVLGDFLVFCYDGKRRFTVLVFDCTACEKVGAFTAMPRRVDVSVDYACDEGGSMADNSLKDSMVSRSVEVRVTPKRESDDCIEMEEPLSKRPSPPGRRSPRFQALASSRRALRTPKQAVGKGSLHYRTLAPRPSSKKKNVFMKTSASVQSCEDHSNACSMLRHGEVLVAKPRSWGLESQRRPVTLEELDKALKMAYKLKSEYPLFVVQLRESYAYGFFMNVPQSFAKEYLPARCIEITLWDSANKRWKVRYDGDVGRRGFSVGWTNFSYQHNLEEGDVCVFELIKKYHMRVNIFRAVSKLTPLIRCSIRKI